MVQKGKAYPGGIRGSYGWSMAHKKTVKTFPDGKTVKVFRRLYVIGLFFFWSGPPVDYFPRPGSLDPPFTYHRRRFSPVNRNAKGRLFGPGIFSQTLTLVNSRKKFGLAAEGEFVSREKHIKAGGARPSFLGLFTSTVWLFKITSFCRGTSDRL